MNLYHLTQDHCNGYDTYSDCVVVAEDELSARTIRPDGGEWENVASEFYYDIGAWPNDIKYVEARLIGTAHQDLVQGVVCSSFHAG